MLSPGLPESEQWSRFNLTHHAHLPNRHAFECTSSEASRRMTVFLFESGREVCGIRKAGFECDFSHRHGAILDKEARITQASFKNKPFRRDADMLAEEPGELAR